jgi:uncharacterized membrane protein YcaP (DUF421 family)
MNREERAMELLQQIFGEAPTLSAWQMADRAVVVFAIALVLVRAAGRRSFGQKMPFDAATTVLLGAILSRAVTGASAFWPTIAAATSLAVLHRVIGLASVRWAWFETVVNGNELEIVRNGTVDRHAMRRALLTDKDLLEAVRRQTGAADLSRVQRAVLERDGRITVITKT